MHNILGCECVREKAFTFLKKANLTTETKSAEIPDLTLHGISTTTKLNTTECVRISLFPAGIGCWAGRLHTPRAVSFHWSASRRVCTVRTPGVIGRDFTLPEFERGHKARRQTAKITQFTTVTGAHVTCNMSKCLWLVQLSRLQT